MCSTRQPAQNRPQTITQQKQKKQNLLLNLQIKSFWEAKIKHVISKAGQKQNSFGEKKDDEHMFTFPFTTVDNSLHSCCTDLKEFYNHAEDNNDPTNPNNSHL